MQPLPIHTTRHRIVAQPNAGIRLNQMSSAMGLRDHVHSPGTPSGIDVHQISTKVMTTAQASFSRSPIGVRVGYYMPSLAGLIRVERFNLRRDRGGPITQNANYVQN